MTTFYTRSVFIVTVRLFEGLLNVQAASGVASRPVANFDPEGNQTNSMKIFLIPKKYISLSGVVFAVGIQSSMVKLYDIRHFDKVCKFTDR